MWKTEIDGLDEDDDTLERIEEALYNASGVIKDAAESLGVHRVSLSKRVSRSPRLTEVLKSIREANSDIAESILFRKLRFVDKNTNDEDKPPSQPDTDFCFKYLDYYNKPKEQSDATKPPVDEKYL